MQTHKKLFIATVSLAVIAIFLSLSAYVTSVSQSSHAASREEIQHMVEKLKFQAEMLRGSIKNPSQKSTPKPTLEASLTTANSTVKADGKDKSSLKVNYKNNTGADMTGAKLLLTMGIVNSSKFDYVTIDLGTIKAGESKSTDVELYLKEPGQTRVKGEIQSSQGKTIVTNPVTITAN